ncbi:MAG: MFS transporter [Coleofasciculaceae cyanobacterium RL_1_1]|nr:MFS transporter [Coleofasciculaceae cyanobacterium RL_1_1]
MSDSQFTSLSPPKPAFKFLLLTSLYTSQFIPSAFFFQALPIILRQRGASLEMIGLIGFLTLPWMLKFLWAPLIDRYGWWRWGHYKSWIIVLQSLLVLTLIVCGTLSELETIQGSRLLFQGVFLVVLLAATQDIATDALAVNLLKPEERGWGNGIQSAGRAIGGILGGGIMLLILNRVGWQTSVWMLAGFTLLALLPLLPYREVNVHPVNSSDDRPRLSYLKTLTAFLRRPHALPWLGFIIFYVTGSSMAATMFRPLLVDLGLSMADIGWMTGIVGSIAAIIGSLLAGVLIRPLGRRRSLAIFGIIQAIAVLALALPALDFHNPFLLYAVSTGEVFARSLANTALFTVMMDKSHPQTAGSDYTLQSSVFIVGHHVGVPALSGFLASNLGYFGVFVMGFVICCISVGLVAKVVTRPQTQLGWSSEA